MEGLLKDLQVHVPTPINFYCNNTAAKYIAEHPIFQERTKHLKIDCHFIRDYVTSGFLRIFHIRTFYSWLMCSPTHYLLFNTKLLNSYDSQSKQAINFQTSVVFFSANVRTNEQHMIKDLPLVCNDLSK